MNCQENTSQILATFYALSALDSLGFMFDNVSITKNWLIAQWIKDDTFKDYSSIPSIEKIVTSLKLLGVNISELSKYDERKAWLVNQKNTIRFKLMDDSLDFFTLSSYYYLSDSFNTIDQNLQSEVYSYIINKQLLDGGYNAINGNYSESKGTYLALSILNNFNLNNINRASIIDFINFHRASYGGFYPEYQSTPTIENTYYALSVLDFFNSRPRYRENLTDFIKNKLILVNQSKETNKPKELFYSQEIFRIVNKSDLNVDIINYSLDIFFINYNYSRQPDLIDTENLYYAAKLSKNSLYKINKSKINEYIIKIQNSDGGFGIENRSRTDITFYAVNILNDLNYTIKNKKSIIKWIKNGQDVRGGFRFRNGNSISNFSDLYSTYLSVNTLALLDEKPQEIGGLCSWIRELEHLDGGFVLSEDSDVFQKNYPKLKNTYWAFKTLNSLGGNEKCGFK